MITQLLQALTKNLLEFSETFVSPVFDNKVYLISTPYIEQKIRRKIFQSLICKLNRNCIPAGFYIYNTVWYKRSKLAYEIIVGNDTSRFKEINSKLSGLSANSLQYYRNTFRKDRDYSILYFLIAWGLNVADATVFAHLKDFDVSDDLTFQFKPGYSSMAHTAGLSLVLAVKSSSQKAPGNFRY